jgi:hypothetical protein
MEKGGVVRMGVPPFHEIWACSLNGLIADKTSILRGFFPANAPVNSASMQIARGGGCRSTSRLSNISSSILSHSLNSAQRAEEFVKHTKKLLLVLFLSLTTS